MDSRTSRTHRLTSRGAAVLTTLLMAVAARADLITPTSIPNPPPAIGSAEGTPTPSPAYVVRDQYTSIGIRFLPYSNVPTVNNILRMARTETFPRQLLGL